MNIHFRSLLNIIEIDIYYQIRSIMSNKEKIIKLTIQSC